MTVLGTVTIKAVTIDEVAIEGEGATAKVSIVTDGKFGTFTSIVKFRTPDVVGQAVKNEVFSVLGLSEKIPTLPHR